MLRLLMSLGSAATKRSASQALAQLTEAGFYPPEWVTGVGKAEPVQAWRRYDVFGDDEGIAVTFRYGEAEHGVIGHVDLTGLPVAVAVGVAVDAANLIEAMTRAPGRPVRPRRDDQPGRRAARVGDAAGPVRRGARPACRSTRWPTCRWPGPGCGGCPPRAPSRGRRFTAADRAAAVEEFLASPLAAEARAADEDATRFWAEVLTGYSSRISGEPPAQVGPRKIALLLGHVPNTYPLSDAQRQHLEPAVTAWVRWSAERRELDEAATAKLMDSLPEVLGRFAAAYDDPDSVTAAATWPTSPPPTRTCPSCPPTWPGGCSRYRFPARRRCPVDLSDPAVRQARVEAEFSACTPHAGMTGPDFQAAVPRRGRAVGRRDRAEAFQAARRLFASGADRHDIIHTLAERHPS